MLVEDDPSSGVHQFATTTTPSAANANAGVPLPLSIEAVRQDSRSLLRRRRLCSGTAAALVLTSLAAAAVTLASNTEKAAGGEWGFTEKCDEEMSRNEDGSLCFDDGETQALVPTVMLLGGQKCATTSLAVQMQEVFPELAFCGSISSITGHSKQERQYFSGSFTSATNCASYYQCDLGDSAMEKKYGPWASGNSCANPDDPQRVAIDYTPTYFAQSLKLPIRIEHVYGAKRDQIKFIMVTRNPTDRLVSYFTHFKPANDINKWASTGLDVLGADGCNKRAEDDFSVSWEYKKLTGQTEVDDQEMDQVFKAVFGICEGAYASHLRAWLEYFAPDQFLLLPMTKYIEEPGKTLQYIGEHAGLATAARLQEIAEEVKEAPHHNTASSWLEDVPDGFVADLTDDVRARLDKFYSKYNSELLGLLFQERAIKAPFLGRPEPY